MIEQVLRHFPPYTYPLTLVSDPDGVLADEGVLAALGERGFILINEPDPIHLRYRLKQARRFSVDSPLIVVTTGQLNQLPYDLWQQGHYVTLALHTFFPNLAYPVVRTLTPPQRWLLSRSPGPDHTLGRQASMDYILRHVFGIAPGALEQPAGLVTWLNRYHQQADPMPPLLADYLLGRLKQIPAYAGWSLEALLANRDTFTSFVGKQWLVYVQQQTGQPLLDERGTIYVLHFAEDEALQDTIPSLVRSGTIAPVKVKRAGSLPAWARPAILKSGEDRRPRRVKELLSILEEYTSIPPADLRWEPWQAIADAWAELSTLRYDPDFRLLPAQEAACAQLQEKLDAAFLEWLRRRYAPLGSQQVPLPHHACHVLHYIAYQRRQNKADRIALLILDGLSLADWYLIGPAWYARHSDWQFQKHLVLAQIPTITPISRQALVSGLRPTDFALALDTNQGEPRHWIAFWARQLLPLKACPYVRLAVDRDNWPSELDSIHTRALCLIDDTIDDIVHGTRQGTAGLEASLRIWLDRQSRRMEEIINHLLARGFTVFLTSDHGHTEALGMGQPAEGLTVQTRGQRARVYNDPLAAANVQREFCQTILWGPDGLLPDYVRVLMPQGRRAFAAINETVVTHGGPTLDEVVVPLITITRVES